MVMEREFRQVDLDALDETWGPNPAERMVQSVATNGVITPVLIAETIDEDGEVKLTLVDGNRRVAASRAAGYTTVPAIVMRGLDPAQLAQVTVIANAMRATNPITEWWAFDELMQAGSSERDLATISGLSDSTVKNRMLMRHLNRTLFEGTARGEIAPTTAMAAARLSSEIQTGLAEVFNRSGRLVKRDVDVLTREQVKPDPGDIRRDLAKLAGQAMLAEFSLEAWRSAADDAWAAALQDGESEDQ